MKDHHMLQGLMQEFFTISTCMTFGAAVYLSIFSIKEISTSLLWQVLLVALVTTLTDLIYHTRRELSKRVLLFRQAVHYLSINVVLLLAAYLFDWIKFTDRRLVVSFIVLVAVVYVLVSTIIYWAYKHKIKRLNEKLSQYQQQEDKVNA